MSKKVLIINDSKFERLIIKDLVLSLGYQAFSGDHHDYSEQISLHSPNIIIANLTMPSISGDKLIAQVKESWPQIQCFLSSCSPISMAKYADQQVDGVFQTPIKSEYLARVLSGNIPLGFCPYCGQKLTPEAAGYRFCPFCGENFAS